MSGNPKDVVNGIYDAVSSGDLDRLDDLLADDLVEHEEFPGLEPNKEGVKQFFGIFRSAFPDLQMKAHQVIAEDDLVCARFTFTGTHQGEFMGMPPSGKRVEVQGMDIVRIREGQVIEHWGVMDSGSMMEQLGAVPEQAPA
jgi:steroid delta-isomerase-like uncharacterized protein